MVTVRIVGCQVCFCGEAGFEAIPAARRFLKSDEEGFHVL